MTDARKPDPSATRRVVPVVLSDRSYDVVVGAGVLSELGACARSASPAGTRVFVGVDANVPAATRDLAMGSLRASGFTPTTLDIVAAEKDKSLAQLELVLAAMTASKLERTEPVIALGGGITGDLVGFAAGVYRRGVPVIQCPSTLLAMVDASVGGKTGVNLKLPGEHDQGLKKNFVGLFHQPRGVFADVTTLRSLSDREFRGGLAECVKHAMLAADFGDPGLLAWLLASRSAIAGRDEAVLTQLIARNVGVKARVVAGDEREEAPGDAGRALLNLGHTFGHAIETLPGLFPYADASESPLKHGEAVSLGLVAAVHTALALGKASPDRVAELMGALGALGLPVRVSGLPPVSSLIELMSHDKKVQSGRLRLVLPTSAGRCAVVDSPPQSVVEAGWRSIGAR
ncbi:MAG: 3-dehydroquinate synthase family protein [Planctomycetota bacterium]